MELNVVIDLVSQRMRGDLWEQVKTSARVIEDPEQATPGSSPQQANMAGKVKAHLQCYAIIAALASAKIPELSPVVIALFTAALPLAAKSISGRKGK